MVRWFNPLLLVKLGWQVIVSELFGQYADQRAIQSALDDVDDKTLLARYDLTKAFSKDKDGSIWLDYVSDLGEGFNSTYAVATLLAQDTIKLKKGHEVRRGDVLIMGGDEVYPTASRDEYQLRMRDPYEMAFPNNTKSGAKHPGLFVIPGNHDWYDGLDSFTGIFCRARDKAPFHGGLSIGNWRCKQHRSYFALKLPYNWWIWGLDIQLTGYVDQPQVNYFRLVADKMPSGAKVIICTAQPSWLRAEAIGDRAYKSLNYIADIASTAKAKPTVCALLSGDVHHYSRYSVEGLGIQFITAGGGGAFLHTTHQLEDELEAEWSRQPCKLQLKTSPSVRRQSVKDAACYPSRETSKGLLWGNFFFWWKNWDFALGLGAIYWLLTSLFIYSDRAALLQIWRGDRVSQASADIGFTGRVIETLNAFPTLLFLWAVVVAILWVYADARNKFAKAAIGVVHGSIHFSLMIASAIMAYAINAEWFGIGGNAIASFIPYLLEMVIAGGLTGGLVWGIYLFITCSAWSLHWNDASSALRVEGYRNFLRLKIKQDELTIYPIGLEAVPSRQEWQENSKAKSGSSKPRFAPEVPLKPHLIEGPVVISTGKVKRI